MIPPLKTFLDRTLPYITYTQNAYVQSAWYKQPTCIVQYIMVRAVVLKSVCRFTQGKEGANNMAIALSTETTIVWRISQHNKQLKVEV